MKNVEDYLKNANLYVHPANYEPLGLVIIEAMASGLPVISFDGNGNRDLMIHGENGYIFQEENAKLFAEKIIDLMNDSEKYEQIVDLGSGEFTVASAYRLGEAHENFANSLLRAPTPKGASQTYTDKLKTELEKVAFPLRDEAYKFFELAHKRSAEVQTFTAWTRRAYQKLSELAPDRNPPVDEISADPSYLSHLLS